MEGSIWISVPSPNLASFPSLQASVLETLLMVLVIIAIKAPYKSEIL
jgi:hypothetical protein